jgi:hypothetical protein
MKPEQLSQAAIDATFMSLVAGVIITPYCWRRFAYLLTSYLRSNFRGEEKSQ